MKYFPATGINVHVHVACPGELRLLHCCFGGNDKDIASRPLFARTFYRFSIERRDDSDMRICLVEMEMNNPVGIVPEQSKSTIKTVTSKCHRVINIYRRTKFRFCCINYVGIIALLSAC